MTLKYFEDLKNYISPPHTALVIIDMQKDLVYDGFLCDAAGRNLQATRNIIPSLRKLLSLARKKNVMICHVGFWTLPDNLSDSGSWLSQRKKSTYSSHKLCMAGSEGAEFIDELKPLKNELIIRKHRYSAFKGTDLDMVLRSRGIKTVITTGVSTNVCVESTLRDAFETGYYVCLPSNATASWNMSLHESTIETIRHRFGIVTKTEDIEDIWNKA